MTNNFETFTQFSLQKRNTPSYSSLTSLTTKETEMNTEAKHLTSYYLTLFYLFFYLSFINHSNEKKIHYRSNKMFLFAISTRR